MLTENKRYFGGCFSRQDTIQELYDSLIVKKILTNNSEDENLVDNWVWLLIKNAKEVADDKECTKVKIKLYEDRIECYHNGAAYGQRQLHNIVSIVNEISNDETSNNQELKKGICFWYEYKDNIHFLSHKFEDEINLQRTISGINEFVESGNFIFAFIENIAEIEIEDTVNSRHIIYRKKFKTRIFDNIYIVDICEINNTVEIEETILVAQEKHNYLVASLNTAIWCVE